MCICRCGARTSLHLLTPPTSVYIQYVYIYIHIYIHTLYTYIFYSELVMRLTLTHTDNHTLTVCVCMHVCARALTSHEPAGHPQACQHWQQVASGVSLLYEREASVVRKRELLSSISRRFLNSSSAPLNSIPLFWSSIFIYLFLLLLQFFPGGPAETGGQPFHRSSSSVEALIFCIFFFQHNLLDVRREAGGGRRRTLGELLQLRL